MTPPAISGGPGASTSEPPGTESPHTTESPLTTAQAGEFLRNIKCAADNTGSWSFAADLINDQPHSRTFTVAIAVTVGMQVKGHDLVVQAVPANGEARITRNYFAQADDKDAVCEPVVSVEG